MGKIYYMVAVLSLVASASALKCYNKDPPVNGTEVECSGSKYCWKLEKGGQVGRGCGGDKGSTLGGYFDKYFKHLGTLNQCLSKKIKIGTPRKFTACACSTNLCNQGSFIKVTNILLSGY